jgi:mannan endo-1,4-beta-mannosidase
LFNQEEVDYIYKASGKRPALVGFDFMHSTGKNSDGVWYKAYSSATLSMATKLWEEGGIPAFCWHWKDPLQNQEAFYTDSTTFDLTTAFTNSSCTAWNANSAAYKAIIKDIDFISGLLKQLQDKGIAVLWRPLHEASGGWFWWGAKGATPCKALYKLMFERMIENGLHNLIWVWTADGAVLGNSFWTDNVIDLISYTFESRPTADRVVVIAHNSNAFEILFVLILPNKIVVRASHLERAENNVSQDGERHVDRRLSYLAMPLIKLPKAFSLTVQKS